MTTIKTISREPTDEMLSAGTIHDSKDDVADLGADVDGIFQAMFDAAPAVSPWVSVKERLPTKEEAAEDGAGLLFTGKNIGFFYGSYDEQQKVFEWDMYAYGLDEVSHFMPIPRLIEIKPLLKEG